MGFVGGTNRSFLDYNFFRKNLETASPAGRQARNAGQAGSRLALRVLSYNSCLLNFGTCMVTAGPMELMTMK